MLVPPNFWTTHPLGLSFLTVGFMVGSGECPMRRVLAVVINYVTLPRGMLESACDWIWWYRQGKQDRDYLSWEV